MVAMPECEKMTAIHEQSQAIGEFLEWLSTEHGWFVAEWDDTMYTDRRAMPIHPDINVLLAEFFGIDLQKVEKERRALLQELGNR